MTSKLSTTIDVFAPPIHPGKILAEEIAARGPSITRLAAYLGTSARFWMNLQATYDLALTRQDHGDRIVQKVRPAAA
jgi:plasmid maintenance system antidote protein VapI